MTGTYTSCLLIHIFSRGKEKAKNYTSLLRCYSVYHLQCNRNYSGTYEFTGDIDTVVLFCNFLPRQALLNASQIAAGNLDAKKFSRLNISSCLHLQNFCTTGDSSSLAIRAILKQVS